MSANASAEIRPGDPRHTAFVVIKRLFALFCVYMIVPAAFYGPIDSLDPAFRIALQMASENGLVWGRDVHFSYGPLSYLATRLAFPGVQWPLVIFDLILYSHLLYVIRCAERDLHTPAEVWCMGLVFFVFAPEFYFTDVSIVLFAIELFFLFRHQRDGSWPAFVSAALFSLYAFYVKGNSGLVAVALVPLSLAVHALRVRRTAASVAALACYAAALWGSSRIVGADLPGYIRGTIHIISAYGDAMFIEPDARHMAYLYGAIVLLFAYAAWAVSVAPCATGSAETLFEIAATGIGLFILFKQGFTRADEHIVAFFKYAPLFLAILYLHVPTGRHGLSIVILVSLIGSIAQASNRIALPLPNEKLDGFVSYLEDAFGPSKDARDNKPNPRDILTPDERAELAQGTVDILPQHSQVIYYNRLRYNPRPMHMTWNVFDRYLDDLNARKISSSTGPDRVLVAPFYPEDAYGFEYETRTKLALLERFELTRSLENGLLALSRMREPRELESGLVRRGRARFGERIEIPETEGLLLIAVETAYTPAARIRRFLYQPPGLEMSFVLENGKTERWQVRKPVIENGLVANRYVRTAADYERFYGLEPEDIPRVEALILHQRDGWGFEEDFLYEISSARIVRTTSRRSNSDLTAIESIDDGDWN